MRSSFAIIALFIALGTAAWIDPVKGAIYVMMVQRPNMPDNFENPPALAFVRADTYQK